MLMNLEMMDFDVVGLAGWRREEIKRQRAAEKDQRLILRVHKGGAFDDTLFAAALEETRLWLQPSEVEFKIWPASEWKNQLLRTAQKSFQKSFAFDEKKMSQLVTGYNQEKPLKDWLLLEHYCYLPLWARRQKVDPHLELILRFEVHRSLMEIRDFGQRKLNPGQIAANDTLDVFDHQQIEVPIFSGKNISVLFVHPESLQVVTGTMTSEEARILDLLEEDVSFSLHQLLNLILDFEWGTKRSIQAWSELISQMAKKGLVLMNQPST